VWQRLARLFCLSFTASDSQRLAVAEQIKGILKSAILGFLWQGMNQTVIEKSMMYVH
jgi:hypothetical protein